MDISGHPSFGALTGLAASAPLRISTPVHKVPEGAPSGGTLPEDRRPPGQDAAAAEARDIAALRQAVARRALPAGPPPAFQISLLEAQTGLDPALARIEATRAQARDEAALQPSEPPAEVVSAAEGSPDRANAPTNRMHGSAESAGVDRPPTPPND